MDKIIISQVDFEKIVYHKQVAFLLKVRFAKGGLSRAASVVGIPTFGRFTICNLLLFRKYSLPAVLVDM